MPRVVNSTDLFGGSSFRVSAVAKGERALQRPIMAIAAESVKSRETRGEKRARHRSQIAAKEGGTPSQENHDKSIGGTLLRLPRIERGSPAILHLL